MGIIHVDFIIVAFAILGVLFIFAALYDWRKLNVELDPAIKAFNDEKAREVKGDASWEGLYSFVIRAARDRFPGCIVWGQYVMGGRGYGLFVANGEKKHMLQLRAPIVIEGKTYDNDILNAESVPDTLEMAFQAIEAAFQRPTPTHGVLANGQAH